MAVAGAGAFGHNHLRVVRELEGAGEGVAQASDTVRQRLSRGPMVEMDPTIALIGAHGPVNHRTAASCVRRRFGAWRAQCMQCIR